MAKKSFVVFENGNNRILNDAPSGGKLTIVNDGFTYLRNDTWKGAGVAIPVFSLRSNNGLGVGEFADIKLLVDWAKKVGLKKIQLLPINDTTATHSWKDSYPYAAISAFALHPLYLHLDTLIPASNKKLVEKLAAAKSMLNALDVVDYEAVSSIKYEILDTLYALIGAKTLTSKGFEDFYAKHQHWLSSYAAFCYCRDQYGTIDFNTWPKHNTYSESDFKSLVESDASVKLIVEKYYFIQYLLDVQLREATAYAHENGVIVKGDIDIDDVALLVVFSAVFASPSRENGCSSGWDSSSHDGIHWSIGSSSRLNSFAQCSTSTSTSMDSEILVFLRFCTKY